MAHKVQYPAYPWERVNGVAGPNLGMRPPCRPPMNHDVHRKTYFYTVLFLDNYYPQVPNDPNPKPVTKMFDVTEDSNTLNLKWLDANKLLVRHNLPLPVSVEMWDHENRPILYCPILAKDVDSITMGDIAVESGGSLIIYFTRMNKPQYNQVYKLVVRSQPNFDLGDGCPSPLPPLPEQQCPRPRGLAMIFRRHSLDALFDLIAEFDSAYYHSLEKSADLQYLSRMSCYKDVSFQVKYTNNLQDVLDLIDVNHFEIKYSWEDGRDNGPPSTIMN